MEAARPDTVVPMTTETSPDQCDAIGACHVRRVGFGATQLAGRCVFGPPRDHGQGLAVLRVAAELGATPAQVGLAWLLARSANVLLIPGTSSVAHLEENVACGAIRLGTQDLSRLDDR